MKIEIVLGSIVEQKVDCIVNPTNKWLAWEDETVNGLIHLGGGRKITQAMEEIFQQKGELKPGDVVYTSGYDLPCKYVIHTLGPVGLGNYDPNKFQQLRGCYYNSLKLAQDLECESISFPLISTGAFQFPIEEAIKISLISIEEFKKINQKIKKIILVCWTKEVFEKYQNILNKKFEKKFL